MTMKRLLVLRIQRLMQAVKHKKRVLLQKMPFGLTLTQRLHSTTFRRQTWILSARRSLLLSRSLLQLMSIRTFLLDSLMHFRTALFPKLIMSALLKRRPLRSNPPQGENKWLYRHITYPTRYSVERESEGLSWRFTALACITGLSMVSSVME